MRLATIETWAGPRAAVLRGDAYVDLHATDPALPGERAAAPGRWAGGVAGGRQAAQRAEAVKHEAAKVKLLAPVPDPRKIICVGLNYRDHAAESGAPIPKEPILFSKYADRPDRPRRADRVAAGQPGSRLRGGAGHRRRQARPAHQGGPAPWTTWPATPSATMFRPATGSSRRTASSGWSARRSTPSRRSARVLVTADEVPDPHNLPIRLRLNGQTMQDSNTKQMIFGVARSLAYLSQVFTLEPGDLIFTGTPPGVGFASKPPVFLKGGDVVEVEIDGLGLLRNPVVQG